MSTCNHFNSTATTRRCKKEPAMSNKVSRSSETGVCGKTGQCTKEQRGNPWTSGFGGLFHSIVRQFRPRKEETNRYKSEALNSSRPQSLDTTYYSTTIAVHHPSSSTTTIQKTNVSLGKIRRTLNSEMKKLSITGRRLDRRFARSFTKASLTSLTKLVLNENRLYRDPRSFRKILLNLPESLEELSISWNGMDAQGAVLLARRLPYLKNLVSISLCGNPIGADGLRSLLEEGKLYRIPMVDLADCDIGNEGAAVLGCYISQSHFRIQNLVLNMNGIGDEGIVSLSQGLAKNELLENLDLYCNEIGDDGVEYLMNALCSKTSKLESLSLRANCLDMRGAKCIAEKLHQTRLKKLNLSHNAVGDGVDYFSRALDGRIQGNAQNLEELIVSFNGLSNKSVCTMAESLTFNTSLQRLALDGNCRVDRRGASSFVKCLQENKSLKELSILEESYENHLLNDKLYFYLELNKRGRRYMGDLTIPDAAWPPVLSAMKRPDHVFLFLQERPVVACIPV